MAKMNDTSRPNNQEVYQATLAGTADRPFLPRLRSDPPAFQTLPRSLEEFQCWEGRAERKRRLRELWHRLPSHHADAPARTIPIMDHPGLTPERAKKLQQMYQNELLERCKGQNSSLTSGPIEWEAFKRYAQCKEAELWLIFHDELDLDGNGHLDANELALALRKAGISLAPTTLTEFITFLTSSPHSHAITFGEFRDFFLLLPRKLSAAEIYHYYEVKKFMGDDGRGAARVTMEGDVSLSAEDRPAPAPPKELRPESREDFAKHMQDDEDDCGEDDDEEHHDWLAGHTSIKFLLAGGVAGAVSRSCTAPCDRLKIFLITRPPVLSRAPKPSFEGLKAIADVVVRIYSEGGILAFWTGNGISIAKIFPESAIKFFAYESAKRAFAKYCDEVEDPREISGVSRFLSGGIGGISSQLSIYPIETLKTQMMSSAGGQRRTLLGAMRHVWALGGLRAYYRGLGIGLVGVFPYSAIDMSTFEALKLTYLRSTGKDEPGVLALLAFGSVSGSVGATSVYPLNLMRTRLQASGSPGHPQRYTGVWDVAVRTFERDGWRGFYRGLLPTLAKVVPSVSISYVVYEHTKRRLGI